MYVNLQDLAFFILFVLGVIVAFLLIKVLVRVDKTFKTIDDFLSKNRRNLYDTIVVLPEIAGKIKNMASTGEEASKKIDTLLNTLGQGKEEAAAAEGSRNSPYNLYIEIAHEIIGIISGLVKRKK